MAGLQEQPRWENEVYRIEENDPVHGGENGITNKPIKQLANRTKYLKQELEKPATTEQVGRVQLDSSTNSTSETTAATPKAVKTVKDLADSNARSLQNVIPNSKKSNSVASTSSDTVATSYAVKQAYDKGVEAKNIAEGKYTAQDATTSQKGITQLDSSTNSISETKAATPKAIKIVKDLADSLQRHFQYFIPNSKKSSDINSTSSDNVATSYAVKKVHDIAKAKQNPATTLEGYGILDGVKKSDLVGSIAFFATTSAPSGWLKANGAAVSRTTYADLFARIGTTFGAGDGRTTFNLPDLRGEFIRGWDDGRNVDSERRLGTNQGDAIRNLTGKFTTAIYTQNDYVEGVFGEYVRNSFLDSNKMASINLDYAQTEYVTFDASRQVPVSNENRPRNVALLACIKY